MNLIYQNITGFLLLSSIFTVSICSKNLKTDLVASDLSSVSEVNSLDSTGIFDPTHWKITFPLENPETGNALEVLNPDFTDYVLGNKAWPEELAKYFYTTNEGQAFKCEYSGVTTPNTHYSRTELREMVGADQHNWTLQDGGHLHGRLKVGDFKEGANKLFFMQIHGKEPSDKPLLKCIWEKGVIRLITKSGERLTDYKKGNNGKYNEIGEGEWFTCTIDVDTAKLIVKINDEIIETFDYEEVLQYWPSNNTYYFKAGNYLQDNTEGAAATVTYSELKVSHDNDTSTDLLNIENNNNLQFTKYPNPFSSETTIHFKLKTASKTNLSIYNRNGMKIKCLYANKMLQPGAHSIIWDGKDNSGISVASGIYFLLFEGVSASNTFKYCDKIVYIK